MQQKDVFSCSAKSSRGILTNLSRENNVEKLRASQSSVKQKLYYILIICYIDSSDRDAENAGTKEPQDPGEEPEEEEEED